MRKRFLLILLALMSITQPASGQSFMARVSEVYLRVKGGKKVFADEKKCHAFLDRSLKEEKPFKVPEKLSASIQEIITGEYRMEVAYIPASKGASQVVLYIHGGAYVNQITKSHWNMLGKVARGSGAAFYIPNYPLAPAHTWKEGYALMDALYRQLLKEYKADDIILMGDSAGGGFALAFAEYLDTASLPQPGKIIAFSPWLDLSMENPEIPDYEASDPMLSAYGLVEMGKRWADGLDLKDYRMSPIYGPLDHLDHIYLFVGTREIFYPDITAFYSSLKQAGKYTELYIGKGLNHVYPVYPIPEAEDAVQNVCRIISQR